MCKSPIAQRTVIHSGRIITRAESVTVWYLRQSHCLAGITLRSIVDTSAWNVAKFSPDKTTLHSIFSRNILVCRFTRYKYKYSFLSHQIFSPWCFSLCLRLLSSETVVLLSVFGTVSNSCLCGFLGPSGWIYSSQFTLYRQFFVTVLLKALLGCPEQQFRKVFVLLHMFFNLCI